MNITELMVFGTVGPPSSAFPKNGKLRRIISMARVEHAQIVKIITLNGSDGSSITNFEP